MSQPILKCWKAHTEDNEMISSLFEYVHHFIPLSEEESEKLGSLFVRRSLKKKDYLVRAGEICRKVVFFNKGYYRFHHTDTTGNEITSDFFFAPGFITSYTSFIMETPSQVFVQAMEEMEVLEINRHDLYQLYDHNSKIERLGRMIAESVAISSEKHLFLLLNQSADERYRRLLERNPEYVKSIPLQYIASYLGITKETLSRMRKSIF